ncbi:hypothetical protein [Frigoriglobus tundricola]|uniref:TIGR03067 domain-containing protein n=1 Tax=Frigoriglobus tundricola TaxID=2774151 RepID=A0A6M5YTM4_9BACT|nr:hypothetical protein [Frigoriglobus tundricola]QJW96794.1 hypothetical protein FTUN_4353 [Frigoriglobus tundricola]
MRIVTGVVLGLALLSGSSLIADDGKNGPEKLKGTWALVSRDFREGPKKADGFKLIISDKSFEFHAPNGATKKMGDISRIEATAKPAQVDLKNGTDAGLGIYELNGDDLKLVIRDPGQERATEFKGTSKGMLFIFKREKK